MKQVSVLSAIIGIAFCLNATPLQALEVEEVIGGDVYRLDTGEEVRLAGVNASVIQKPGFRGEGFTQEALGYISGLFSKAEVIIEEAQEVPRKDKRRQVYIYIIEDKKNSDESNLISRTIPEKTMVNLEIIKRGYGKKAWSYRGPYSKAFDLAQREAKMKKMGMWRS